MLITINIIEVASELAESKLFEYANSLSESEYSKVLPNGLAEVDGDVTSYTEDAQDLFNRFYDEYFDTLLNNNIED